ncbi:PAS domain S-box protein, partial [Stenotrophomonas maltophilia]|uniref:PAS domain S-box protein n=1 Tax=Stenotrophomonas maltophilia TaxID=40324 RepID=UPI0039F6934D
MDEASRLCEIERLGVLDTPPEPVFDAIVAAARAATGMPMGLISIVAEHRQWFKANIGLPDTRETPRNISFCTHAIEQDTLLEIPDAHQDPRFASNPLVTGGPRIRHYAGIPLGTAHGARIGTLCLLDTLPGVLSPSQRELMVHLGRVTTQVLEQRAALMQKVDQAQALHRELKRSEDFLERTNTAAKVGGWELDLTSNEVRWTRETKQIHGVRAAYQPTLDNALSFYREDSRAIIEASVQRCVEAGTPWEVQLPMTTADGRAIWTRVVGSRQQVEGRPRLVGAIQDITDERAVLDALEASEVRYRRLFHYSLGLICTHTLDGTLTSVNPAAVQSLGFPESQMVGRSLCDLMPPEKREAFRAYLKRIEANHTDAGVIELIAADGTRRYWAYHNVLDSEAHPPFVLGHAQDVTALRLQEARLRELSQKDPLTLCHNRRYLHRLEQLEAEPWACLVCGPPKSPNPAAGDPWWRPFNPGGGPGRIAACLGGDDPGKPRGGWYNPRGTPTSRPGRNPGGAVQPPARAPAAPARWAPGPLTKRGNAPPGAKAKWGPQTGQARAPEEVRGGGNRGFFGPLPAAPRCHPARPGTGM